MSADKTIDLALRSYPGWWRERYADEVSLVSHDLAAEGHSTPRIALNLLGGSIQARAIGRGMPKSYRLYSLRTRTSIAAATLPWLIVVPFVMATMGSVSFHSAAGPIGWSGFSAYPSHLQFNDINPRPVPSLTAAGHLALYSALAITVLFLVTFVVLISGWSGLSRGIRQSNSPQKRRLRLLAWTPVFALLVDVALVIAQGVVRPNSLTGHMGHFVLSGGNPTVLHVLNIVVPVVAISGWFISAYCVAVAARRANIAPADLRFGKSVAVTVATLFTLLGAAYATWGIGLLLQSRQAATGDYTTVGYAHIGLWIPVMSVLVIAIAVSVASACAARGSWKAISSTLL